MIKIIPLEKKIKGIVTAPPSKAYVLRAFFIGALASGKTVVINPLLAEDQMYAIEALKNFGAKFKVSKDKVVIQGTGGKLKMPKTSVFIGNSGVTARFLASFAALTPGGKIRIDGSERMRTGRPIQDLLDALTQLEVQVKSTQKNGCLPIEVEGGSLKGGKTSLKGGISSQYFSSILIAAPYAEKDTTIKCIGEMSSKPYIDITLDIMRDFGVKAENENYKKFFVKSGQKYIAREYKIEGDYTNASYFFSATAICGGKIKIKNLKLKSAQGDKIFIDILKDMNCEAKKGREEVELISTGGLKPIAIDMNSYPDLVPSLAVVSAFAEGKSEIYNIEHLRYKECDRIAAVANELRKTGVRVKEKRDGLIIYGDPSKIHGAKIDCYNDHRIAMAFSVMGLKIPGIIIKDEKCVEKSFVDFYEVLEKIRG